MTFRQRHDIWSMLNLAYEMYRDVGAQVYLNLSYGQKL